MNIHDIIIRPVVSEKSVADIKDKKYTFIVHTAATKPQIKQAIEQIFSVKVESVNTSTGHTKVKRQGRHEGETSQFKKAYVQLTKDSKPLEFFESLQ
jgi:large subunit ribosomal protein L23